MGSDTQEPCSQSRAAALAIFNPWQHLALGGTVAFALIRDDDAGHRG